MEPIPPQLWQLVGNSALVGVLLVGISTLWKAYTWKRDQVERMVERIMTHAQLMEAVNKSLERLAGEVSDLRDDFRASRNSSGT